MPHLTTVLNGSASLIPAFIHVDKNFLFDGGFGIDTDDGSQRLNVTNNVVLTGLWKDGIANSHKSYSGNVELFGGGCFNSGQWDKGSSNFTDNHCFVDGKSSNFNCNCNVSCSGWPETCTPCPGLRNNHYYQQNQTYVVCGNLTLPQIQARGLEIGSTVSPVPDADGIVEIVKAQLSLKADDETATVTATRAADTVIRGAVGATASRGVDHHERGTNPRSQLELVPDHIVLVAPTGAAASSSATSTVPAVSTDFDTLVKNVRVVKNVHEAALVVRNVLAKHPRKQVEVQLLPGVHHIGDSPLVLGPRDGAAHGGSVTWKSADQGNPATLGAPIRVTGWKPHAAIKGAFSAPLPANVTKGTALRQLWVDGLRAERPRIHGTGIQQGDNKMGRCLNLTNATSTAMYPQGAQYDFSNEMATDPSTWANPQDVEFVYTGCDAVSF